MPAPTINTLDLLRVVLDKLSKIARNSYEIERRCRKDKWAPVGTEIVNEIKAVNTRLVDVSNELNLIKSLIEKTEITIIGKVVGGESLKETSSAIGHIQRAIYDLGQFIQMVESFQLTKEGKVRMSAPPERFPRENLMKLLEDDNKNLRNAEKAVERVYIRIRRISKED